MKNDHLTKKILSGTLAITIFLTGYSLGKRNSKQGPNLGVDTYKINYDTKNYGLESKFVEIKYGEAQEKNGNKEGFNAQQLFVMEGSNINDESNLYILNQIGPNSNLYEEYHGLFGMYYGMDFSNCNVYYYKYADFNRFQPLTNYLTEDEMARLVNTNGKISSSELDVVLNRIRKGQQPDNVHDMFELVKSDNPLPRLK